MLDVRRREFITVLGGAVVAWSHQARAQQPAMPVIGFVSARSPGDSVPLVGAFRRSLMDGGFVEGQNVAIEYRWAHGDYARLPALAKELVDRKVSVLVGLRSQMHRRPPRRSGSSLKCSMPQTR
jgi:putative ABC transport system substrate-binding protein